MRFSFPFYPKKFIPFSVFCLSLNFFLLLFLSVLSVKCLFFSHTRKHHKTLSYSRALIKKRRSRFETRFHLSSSLVVVVACVSRAVEWHWPFLEEQQQEQHSRERFPRWKEEEDYSEFYQQQKRCRPRLKKKTIRS